MKIEKRWRDAGSVLIYGHYAAAMTVGGLGVAGITSPSVTRAVGVTVASALFSGLFLAFGGLALYSRLHRRVTGRDTLRSEVWCIAMIGLAYAIWGVATVWVAWEAPPPATGPPAPPYGAIQTGVGLIGASLFLPGAAAVALADLRRVQLHLPSVYETAIGQVEAEMGRRGRAG